MCWIVVSDFEFKLLHYFQTRTLGGKKYELLSPFSYRLNSTTFEDGFGII